MNQQKYIFLSFLKNYPSIPLKIGDEATNIVIFLLLPFILREGWDGIIINFIIFMELYLLLYL